MEEQEIDLRKYVRGLFRYWYFPLGFLVAGIVLTAGLAARQPRIYQGRALVAAISTPQGITDEAFGAFLNQFFTSAAERKQHMAALQALVVNPAVAQAVLDELGESLPASLRNPEALLRSAGSRLVSGTDLIEVSVSHADPQLALTLANAWAKAYVSEVGDVYGDVRRHQRQALADQVLQAKDNYGRAQSAWEDALRQDRFAPLSRDLAGRQAMLQALSTASDTALVRLVDEVGRTELLLADVGALKSRMIAGGSASANASSLIMLQARALASLWDFQTVASQPLSHPADRGLPAGETAAPGSPAMPAQGISPQLLALQLQSAVPDMTAKEIVAELELLEESLRTRLASQRQALDAANAALEGGEIPAATIESSRTASALEDQIRDLRVQLAQEESRLQMAKAMRDVAWQTYQDAARQEADFARALANQQEGLRVAAPAQLYDPLASGRKTRLLSGAVVGLIFGSLVSLALGWLRRPQAN